MHILAGNSNNETINSSLAYRAGGQLQRIYQRAHGQSTRNTQLDLALIAINTPLTHARTSGTYIISTHAHAQTRRQAQQHQKVFHFANINQIVISSHTSALTAGWMVILV